MASTTANSAEFQTTGKPVANPVYLIDANGNPISSTNALNVNASFSASSVAINDPNTTTNKAAVDSNGNIHTSLYQGTNQVTVTQFHSADNQNLGSGNGLLVGGVAQIMNPAGTLDRQRGTGADSIPAVGVATGTQQLAGPQLTTTLNGAITGSNNTQTITVISSTNMKVGDIITTSDNVESTEVLTVPTGTTFTAVLKNNHGNSATLSWYHYNQARDATVGDNTTGIGLSPSATFLYNNISTNFEYDRSANGEKDGASGFGTAVAAEYEWNGGGPLNNTSVISGLQFDRARNLQAKGLGSGTISNNPLAAGSTTLTLNSAPTTLMAGQQIILDRAGANPEGNYVSTSYTPGSTSVGLQNATGFSHAQNSTVEWDQFASLGPQLNGFTAAGIGIEEEALYNPVDGKFYIERSATADTMAGANIVAEAPALWNGSTFDRLKGDNTGAARVSLYGKNSAAGDTVIVVNSAGDIKTTGDFVEQASLSAGSLNADLVPSTDVSTYKSFSVHINANAYNGILTFQCSNDNTNWVSLNVFLADSNSALVSTVNSINNKVYFSNIFFRFLRVRMTTYSSGTAQGTLELYTYPIAGILSQVTVQPGNTANTTPWLVNTPGSDITVFASAAQTTTQTQADQTNNSAKGIKVVLDMTNVAASPSVTLEIDGKDIASGKYYSLLTGAAVVTVSTNVYTVYPGLTAAANVTASDVLPHTWRIKVTANNANSGTYSVGASLLT